MRCAAPDRPCGRQGRKGTPVTLERTQAGAATLPKNLAANPLLSSWVSVHADGIVDVRVGKVELGQGILTALAQLAADELDMDLTQVRMLPANTANGPDEGLTSGSMSIAESGAAVCLVAANVRALFVCEAARRWQVAATQVTVQAGLIASPQAPETTSYAALADAVDLEVAADAGVPVKTPEQRRVAGTSAARLDLPDKVAGRARFIHDLRLPGQLFGRVVRPPSPGAQLVAVDASAVAGLEVQVVRDGSFRAVRRAGRCRGRPHRARCRAHPRSSSYAVPRPRGPQPPRPRRPRPGTIRPGRPEPRVRRQPMRRRRRAARRETAVSPRGRTADPAGAGHG